MGLAAFGTPRFRDEFAKLITIHRDGSFELAMPYFAFHTDTELGFGPKLETLLGPRRAPGRPWDLEAVADDRRYADVAATLQAVTEDALLALAARRAGAHGCRRALPRRRRRAQRCRERAAAARERASADLRAARRRRRRWSARRGDPRRLELDGKRPPPMRSAALGQAPCRRHGARPGGAARSRSRPTRRRPRPRRRALVARGDVVAFARGRFEWGPRALGQRSILAAPRDAAMARASEPARSSVASRSARSLPPCCRSAPAPGSRARTTTWPRS